jgi:hypothetical protein
MTLKEAIELSFEVWHYLAAHPEITDNHDLPKKLFGKIKNMWGQCPLCEYDNLEKIYDCAKCQLVLRTEVAHGCLENNHPYLLWLKAKTDEERIENATAIVKLLEAALEKENRNEKSN